MGVLSCVIFNWSFHYVVVWYLPLVIKCFIAVVCCIKQHIHTILLHKNKLVISPRWNIWAT